VLDIPVLIQHIQYDTQLSDKAMEFESYLDFHHVTANATMLQQSHSHLIKHSARSKQIVIGVWTQQVRWVFHNLLMSVKL